MPIIKHQIKLEESQREFLNNHTKSGNWTSRQVLQAKVLLLTNLNGPFKYVDSIISKRLDCSLATEFNIRRRFCSKDYIEETLFVKTRTGRPTLIDGSIDAHITAIAYSHPPQARAKWTLRMIKERLVILEVVDKISRMTVARALKKKKLNHG